jgi:predicted Zn-dependent protease
MSIFKIENGGIKVVLATAYSGNVYSIVGTVSEVRDELNRINAKPDRCVNGGNNSGTITIFVGTP